MSKIALFTLFLFYTLGCSKNENPVTETPETVEVCCDTMYVRLQNQTDHSAIMVKLIEPDIYVLTDSTGAFAFDTLAVGSYILEAKYPYFRIEQITFEVKEGNICTPVDIELRQQMQFWIEPAETTISMNNLSNPDFFELSGLWQYRINITDEPVKIGTYFEPIELWALVPQDFNWPYVPNPENRPDECYERYSWFGDNILIISWMYTFAPGDTSYKIILSSGNDLRKECFRAGTYLFYSAPSDLGHFPEYFHGPYFWVDTLSQPQPYNPLNRTLFKKWELFRPAVVHITD